MPCVLIVTACTNAGVKTINNIPSELLIEQDRPEPPPEDFEQADFGEYAKELDDSLKQCTSDKKSINEWIEAVTK